ncbi:transmembrane and death domain protein 1 [Heteronotia binoei]|uniref:transmembrane and death domain protein 1 n=1 Tax=Heteronotia binoei TaxID=13085 RepID=UPI00292E2AC4|nr:transmembrane and death domain protein 1 [Heteronotia binoei]
MLVLMEVTLLLLATHTSYINMAVTSPEATTLDHISELLNPEECREFYIRIAVTQKDVKEPLEKDPFPPSQWQEISSMAQCKETLNHWLEMERGTVDWDRLARALRQIGRPDVSRELKKSLNKNRSLEPKWNVEDNQTVETVKSALLIQNKAPHQRRRHSPIHNNRKGLLKEMGWDMKTFFMRLFPAPWHKLNIQECIGPATRVILVSFLTGLILWLVSVYYVICWNLGQCLFASGVHYNTPSPQQNMNFTMILNDQLSESSLDEGEEDPDTSGDELATDVEF